MPEDTLYSEESTMLELQRLSFHVSDEGQNRGIDRSLAELLAAFSPIPATYAGGVGSFEDIETLCAAGRGRIDFTIGSHLDLFGGELPYEEVICRVKELSGS